MVSVIIPSYNYGHLIGDTIQSILVQTYADIEIIVIDDGSADSTKEIVTTMAQKDNRIFYHGFSNTGLGTSRNRGLQIAKGEFIQFLDADDLLERKKLETQIHLFKAHPGVDIVYGSVRYFKNDPHNPDDRLLTYWGSDKEWMPKLSGPGKNFLASAMKGNFSHLSSALFRRSVVDKVGLFDNEISAVADYHFLLRSAILNADFLYHDTAETYSLVRWHPDNMSKDPAFMRREEIKMRKRLMPLLLGDSAALTNNENAIKAHSMMIAHSWKRIFLSGGPFDFLKKIVRMTGMEKIVQKLFYR